MRSSILYELLNMDVVDVAIYVLTKTAEITICCWLLATSGKGNWGLGSIQAGTYIAAKYCPTSLVKCIVI